MQLLTLKDVARIWRMRPDNFRRAYIETGILKASKTPSGAWRISELELEDLLNNTSCRYASKRKRG